jgi:cation diffusion facilitator family transporter
MVRGDLQGGRVRAAALSIASNTLLVVAKLTIGFLSNSVAVMSEAIHSASDLLASFLALFSIRAAGAPADERHPYGHGKAESLSSLFQAILIFAGACVVIVEAIRKVAAPTPVHTPLAIGVMGVSAVLNLFVCNYLLRTARRTESPALKADGYHLLTDVWTSGGVLAGLLVVHLTGYDILDPLAALVVSVLIVRTSWLLIVESVQPLMDVKLPEAEEGAIRDILQSDPLVLGYHKLRTRRAGRDRHVDVHVLLPDEMTLVEAHNHAEVLEDRARQALPNLSITIHFEPHQLELAHQRLHHQGNK